MALNGDSGSNARKIAINKNVSYYLFVKLVLNEQVYDTILNILENVL